MSAIRTVQVSELVSQDWGGANGVTVDQLREFVADCDRLGFPPDHRVEVRVRRASGGDSIIARFYGELRAQKSTTREQAVPE